MNNLPTAAHSLISWNVNGLRSIASKGLSVFLQNHPADIYCFQETKAQIPDIEAMRFRWPKEYQCIWYSAEKKGYSSTGVLTRIAPADIMLGIGYPAHDKEGRVITLDLDSYYLVNVYTPNSQPELTRLDYRTREWDPAFREFCCKLANKKPVIICGDLNVAHKEIDLARPEANRHNAGFTDEERQTFQQLLDAGFTDTFRLFVKDGGHYTWWSYMNQARARNIGWRIDYFLVSNTLVSSVKNATILPEVTGSDHCPVTLQITPPPAN